MSTLRGENARSRSQSVPVDNPVDAYSRRGAAAEQILPSIWTDQGCEVCKCVTFVEGGGRDRRSSAWLIDFATDA
jgi:hypothetical protein